MSENVQVALIISIAPTVAAIAAVISSLLNSRKLRRLHIDLNSRLSQLLRMAGDSARAEGHAAGMREGRQMGITEGQDRVTEEERVADRADEKLKH